MPPRLFRSARLSRVNDHGDKTVDAFYFYFYAFDFGGNYFDQDVGDHIGDWEHNMIRFVDEKPSQVWFSQHSAGQAFEYKVLEKFNGGPRVSNSQSLLQPATEFAS